ncbi:metalloregulator ArsR/SmtB family transcription factor [Virgibacillus sp. YIM 98842]|uniref:ArsR/SmtB family transcription factor n=1 Tax=Virgibacillus sp. YIM 98842 TaxID=2663533 RepID=UPI001F0942C6|nr:metalloregulator ArsR/SmtB family transcription factor [Virgibacillus sp. YIM 98842]
MERNLFTPAFPETKLRIEQSPGVNLMTNIQLIDYFLNSPANPSGWVKEFSGKLNQTVLDDLKLLRTVFAHGVIFRQFYMNKHGRLNQSWDQFINWWKQLPDERVMELIIYGITETMDYYYKYLPPMTEVERIMEEVSLKENDLKDPRMRKQALRAVLQSWSVENIEEIIPLYQDIKLIKHSVIRLLEGFWLSGFQAHWEKVKSSLSDWETDSIARLSSAYSTNAEAIYGITGLYPDTNELDQVNRAKEIIFIPVTNLGRLIVLYHTTGRLYVMFEPDSGNRNFEHQEGNNRLSDFYMLFEGLGDRARLQIIELIAENKEMFAQQIVNQLKMKQSTVSRHLNQLHQSGLVNIRQEGTTKYFSINKNEFGKVKNFLDTILKI